MSHDDNNSTAHTQLANNSHCDNNCQDLQPRWSGSDGVDNLEKAIGFVCHRCHKEYSPFAAKQHLELNRPEPSADIIE
ncbi:MAG: hypothetical protein DK305_000358 [Chloroflexi bacterium]|mgnify:CR=1 FL=1|jgi:hypothetical protein|nr:MAG: hypothetical protein DK305_000358 [Chloroflexota bacterium]|tara:strand:- start:248 stop:481 length:234 start_codon:yes stop_codon:yes gene_type:complete